MVYKVFPPERLLVVQGSGLAANLHENCGINKKLRRKIILVLTCFYQISLPAKTITFTIFIGAKIIINQWIPFFAPKVIKKSQSQ
jgi:hypothetical protein